MIRKVRPPFWWVVVAGWLVAGVLVGCEQGSEGDRCNPDLVNSSECNAGLACVTPSSCVISVCCPSAPPYSDPQCECFANPQGAACLGSCSVDAAYDAGATSSAVDAADATTGDASHE